MMSELINTQRNFLESIANAPKAKFEIIVKGSDSKSLTSISEVFLNIGNLNIDLSAAELRYFKDRIELVQRLIDIKGSKSDQKFVLENQPLVKRGVACAIRHLYPDRE